MRRAKGFTPPLTPPKPLLNSPLKGRTSCGKCNASNTVPTPNPSPSRGGEPRPSFLSPPLEGEGLGVGSRSEKPMEKASVRGRSSGFVIRSHRIEGFAIPPFFHSITNVYTRIWRLAISIEETKGLRRGRKPPVGLRQQKKPRGSDRDRCKLLSNKLHVLSPFRGLLLSCGPAPGTYTPVCALSHLWCLFSGQQ